MKVICVMIAMLGLLHEVKAQFVQASHADTTFTNYFRNTEAGTMTAGDGGMSVKLPDGRTVWLISDSYITAVNAADTTLACLFDINNCLMVQDSAQEDDFITLYNTEGTGVNRTYFTTAYCPGGNDRFWPAHGYAHEQKFYAFLHRYQGAAMDFAGVYLAQMSLPELTVDSITEISQTDILWGHYVMPNAAGDSLYIYGTRKNWITYENYVARCPMDGIYSQWQYYTGSTWTSNPTMAGKISISTTNVFGNGMSVLQLQHKYYLFLQENGFLTCGQGRDINVFKSNTPWGPFENEKTIYTIPNTFNQIYLITYQAFAHNQFTRNDEVLISYAVNDICPSQCQNLWSDRRNADTYRLNFVRAPFSVIDPELQLHVDLLQNQSATSSINIYPNPVTSRLNISVVNKSMPIDRITILRGDAKFFVQCTQKSLQEEQNTYTLDMQSYTPGVYVLKVESGNTVWYRKIIKL